METTRPRLSLKTHFIPYMAEHMRAPILPGATEKHVRKFPITSRQLAL
jgi:hypothetical protein